MLTSVAVTGAVWGVRSVGLLQPLELWAFDRSLALRPAETLDSRLLVVAVSEADIQAQKPGQRRGSLSDQTLNQLLQRLEELQPRVIGLDVYRDFPVDSQNSGLKTQLQQNKRLIAICKGATWPMTLQVSRLRRKYQNPGSVSAIF